MFYCILALCGGIAWFISTICAGGAATLLIPVVTFLIGAQVVAPIISVAAFCTNPSRIWLFRDHIDWRVLVWLLPGSLLGAAIGAWLFSRFSADWIQTILALFLISYVFQYHFGRSKIRFRMKRRFFLIIGLTISFISGLVGATGPVLNPFMLNYGLNKEHLVATKSVNSLAMQLTKLTTYSIFGSLTLEVGIYGVVLAMGAVVGVYLARHHLLTIEGDRFRSYTMIMMAVVGILMLIKQIVALEALT